MSTTDLVCCTLDTSTHGVFASVVRSKVDVRRCSGWSRFEGVNVMFGANVFLEATGKVETKGLAKVVWYMRAGFATAR